MEDAHGTTCWEGAIVSTAIYDTLESTRTGDKASTSILCLVATKESPFTMPDPVYCILSVRWSRLEPGGHPNYTRKEPGTMVYEMIIGQLILSF